MTRWVLVVGRQDGNELPVQEPATRSDSAASGGNTIGTRSTAWIPGVLGTLLFGLIAL